MSLHESAEMYLETIYILSLNSTCVRSIDVAEALNYSRPSVSRAVGLLKKDGYLLMDEEGYELSTGRNAADGSITFPAGNTGTVSVFCLGPDAEGVTLEGLYYPLEKGTLTAGFPLGVSNHFVGNEVTVSVEQGSLLLLFDRENGFPR